MDSGINKLLKYRIREGPLPTVSSSAGLPDVHIRNSPDTFLTSSVVHISTRSLSLGLVSVTLSDLPPPSRAVRVGLVSASGFIPSLGCEVRPVSGHWSPFSGCLLLRAVDLVYRPWGSTIVRYPARTDNADVSR